jgi:PAS domain-containing protein
VLRFAARTRELAEHNTRLRLFFDLSLVGVIISSNEGIFVEVNREFCRLSGCSRQERTEIGWPDLALPAEHGGTISVDSELGAGTRFTVDLPLLDPSRESTGPPDILVGGGWGRSRPGSSQPVAG